MYSKLNARRLHYLGQFSFVRILCACIVLGNFKQPKILLELLFR